MARVGPAWRGYFPLGAELTSGQPDLKEGLYFGAELSDEDPRVRAGLPLHGRNLFPRQVPELRAAVLAAGRLDLPRHLGEAGRLWGHQRRHVDDRKGSERVADGHDSHSALRER